MNVLTNGFRIMREDGTYNFHSLDDFGIAVNEIKIDEPKPFTKYVNIPGRNGSIDLSEKVGGGITFQMRKIEIECGALAQDWKQWLNKISLLRNRYEGRRCRIIIDSEDNYFWIGRVSIEDFEQQRKLGTFKLCIYAEPYKYFWCEPTTEEWYINPLDVQRTKFYEYSITELYTVLPMGGPGTLAVNVTAKTANMSVSIGGKSHTLTTTGWFYFPDMICHASNEQIKITLSTSGYCTAKFYRYEGSL